MTTRTPPEWARGTSTPGVSPRERVRDALGSAHYGRLRHGVAGELDLPPWEQLSDGARDAYSSKFDYLLPELLGVVRDLMDDTRDDMHSDLLDEGIL